MSNTGPGKTCFIPNADGSINVRRWNDLSWETRFAAHHELSGKRSSENITRLLARAYQMGMDDKATLIKQAIGI
jgi:hypothetical protein